MINRKSAFESTARNLVFLVLGMFSVGCNTFLTAGLLAPISQTLGQPIAVTEQGISLFSFAYLISAPLFSILFANKSVKRTIQLALTVFIFGNLITLLSENIVLFFFGRCLAGIGAGISTPLCITMLAGLIIPLDFGKASAFSGCNFIIFRNEQLK